MDTAMLQHHRDELMGVLDRRCQGDDAMAEHLQQALVKARAMVSATLTDAGVEPTPEHFAAASAGITALHSMLLRAEEELPPHMLAQAGNDTAIALCVAALGEALDALPPLITTDEV